MENQAKATVDLWTVTSYLLKEKKNFMVPLVPAIFMTVVVISNILFAPEGFRLPYIVFIWSDVCVALFYTSWTFYSKKHTLKLVVLKNYCGRKLK